MMGSPAAKTPQLDRPVETVLVTNDDGVSSPFFQPTIEALRRCGRFKRIIFVAPAEEQSWIGSAVTRFRPVYAEPMLIDGCSGFVVSGTPSDCVYLGIDNLFGFSPDLVISGINLGTNTGRAFAVSSGTVSGALAAFLCSCRSIAVSAKVPPSVFEEWGRHDLRSLSRFSANWQTVADAAARLVLKFIEIGIWQYADVPAIDLPWDVSQSTPLRVTEPDATHYRKIFEKVGDGKYLHSFKGLVQGDPLGRNCVPPRSSDTDAVSRGEISINPLSYGLFGSPHLGSSAEILAALRGKLEERLDIS